jgi:K+/H+ antiporter YhaU regulatory subunit KhtT
MLIPEAQSDGASNITMHQLLRLCYSDQRTPATRLFRFENFDTQNIREAVGDLICGISGYELYELTLKQRERQKEYDDVNARLSALLRSLRSKEAITSPAAIRAEIGNLARERERIEKEIDEVDELIEPGEVSEYVRQRRDAQQKLVRERDKLRELETSVTTTEFEQRELAAFLDHLAEQTEKLARAESTFDVIGHIDFVHCPACGETLSEDVPEGTCAVCKMERDPEKEQSRYNQIRLDLEIQMRETHQLISDKEFALSKNKQQLRQAKLAQEQALRDFSLRFSGKNGPREAFLAERASRLGHIDAATSHILARMETAEEIERLSKEKSEINEDLEKIKSRIGALRTAASKRRSIALTTAGRIAARLLRSDLPRQEEFINAQNVTMDFQNDSMTVDGKINFAESSNVYLKNASILALFLAAGQSSGFFHPHFALFDNIEDKGMQEERSHLFQRLIVENVTEIEKPFQLIFTTSMMNPELELEDYVIGPAYTKENKTLDLGIPKQRAEQT